MISVLCTPFTLSEFCIPTTFVVLPEFCVLAAFAMFLVFCAAVIFGDGADGSG